MALRQSAVAADHGNHTLLALVDTAVFLLEFADVVAQCGQQPLGVLRRHDDAGGNVSLGHSRHHGYEIKDELVIGMGDNGQVGIGSFGYLFAEVDVDFLLLHDIGFSYKTKKGVSCSPTPLGFLLFRGHQAFILFHRADLEVLVPFQAGTRRNEVSHDDVLLQTQQVVGLRVDSGVGEHLGSLLERGG